MSRLSQLSLFLAQLLHDQRKSWTKRLYVLSKNVDANVLEVKIICLSRQRKMTEPNHGGEEILTMKRHMRLLLTSQYACRRIWKLPNKNINKTKLRKRCIIRTVKPCLKSMRMNGRISKLQKLSLT